MHQDTPLWAKGFTTVGFTCENFQPYSYIDACNGIIDGNNTDNLCDLVSRSIFPEREIPVGVITALLGGPLFLWILHHKKHNGTGATE